ncbi:MAG: orotidine-5'-phosphate decarboxylase [Clostridia bacterium]|nr:orotidine-5'-phosphate decarboxylase [Clostridia bacterium]
MYKKDRLIVALDKPSLQEAQELVFRLEEKVTFYKVGLELFLNSRGEIIEFLKKQNKKIFLDLKFHDIPNTVAQAAKWAVGLGLDMFNVHASGGEEMLKRTVEMVNITAEKNNILPPKVIAVTVLTSFDEAGFAQLGFRDPIKETARKLAIISQKAGLDGVVCSPWEAQEIKNVCGQGFLTVCPGVRPLGSHNQDQKRTMTPGEAIKNGVDYLVVGRPINQSADPQAAAREILQEMEEEK